MSVQFGRWSFSGLPAAPDYLDKAAEMLAPYGPDGGGRYSGPGVDIIYRAFHTTRESRREQQPRQLVSGAVLTWDGRLDNREELVRQLGPQVTLESADVAIAAAAYEQWGTSSFAKLIGDWALSIWEPQERALILARDFLGTRHLYYAVEQEQVVWSTILDPLVLLAGKTFELEEEYIAGWLAFFPAAHLTPYVGIHAVPPSTFVCLRPGTETITKYWDFDPHKQIRYASDNEYEEHFRTVFGESVRRRLRSDAPVLAELSGGMDSSSIVCMADQIIAQGSAETPRLDTVSYYDDLDPNWNERPYFKKVEEKRGRRGCHIYVGSDEAFSPHVGTRRFAATPALQDNDSEPARAFASCLASGNSRVLLSGTGGDEVTGGVPTPIPELADLLSRARLLSLAHELKSWALNQRRPWFHLLFQATREFFPAVLVGMPKSGQPAGWLHPEFVRHHRKALSGYEVRLKLLGPLPSIQENLNTLRALQRQLGCAAVAPEPLCEKCYPFLDRDFLELIYAIPREQLVRPGHRRSLMRRALVTIVPPEILNRRRKAFATRSARKNVSEKNARAVNMKEKMISSSLGITDSQAVSEALNPKSGGDISILTLMRSFAFEAWLRNLNLHKVQLNRPSARRVRGTVVNRFEGLWRSQST